jgi:transposase
MVHELKMAVIDSILQLRALHWSARRIARELGIDRGTIGKYLRNAEAGSKPAISPAGSGAAKPATFPPFPGTRESATDGADGAASLPESKPAISPAGSPGAGDDRGERFASPADAPAPREVTTPVACGRPSECAPYRSIIVAKLDLDLSAQRIFQDLVSDHGFTGSYDSVKRFVRRLGNKRTLPMRRIECAAGEEAQVDFGTGAPVIGPDGKRRKTYVFRIVLSHSRKAYSEVTFRQTTEDFIACVENALWHLGGCPKVLVIDNLRAAVKHPDWFDPELVPKLRSFCRHYGIVILPTKPYTPRHKGKVESGVKYVQNNALKARKFLSLQAENEYLAHWEAAVADTRIHGTTRQQVGRVFREVERPALQPLPRERFPCFQEAPRKVSRDGHVEVARAYYSVPPEYLGQTVWARWDARLVRIFNPRFEQIALHVRHAQGRFSTDARHLAPEKISGLERGAAALLRQVHDIGPQTHHWAEAMLHARGIEGTRVLLGVLNLTTRHSSAELEKACDIALSHGAFHLRTLRQLLGRHAARQLPLSFLEAHPIIRPLDDYAHVVSAALARRSAADERGERHDWTKAPSAATQQNSPDGQDHRGTAELLPPRSEYPSAGCSPAAPASVSSDSLSVVRPSSCQPLFPEKESDA